MIDRRPYKWQARLTLTLLAQSCTLIAICPWSWYIAITASYLFSIAWGNTESAGIGPVASIPRLRASATAWSYLLGLFGSQQTAVRGVRIEGCHSDSRLLESPLLEALIRQHDLGQDVSPWLHSRTRS